jgi:hypothetical protein
MLIFVKMLMRVLIVFITVLFAVQLATCGVATPVPTPTSQYLDTPSWISQALNRGEITDEERLLYLAYALYEYKSLPPQYLSSVGWFGDAAVGELIEAVNSPATLCSMSHHIRSELLRVIKKTEDDTVCN